MITEYIIRLWSKNYDGDGDGCTIWALFRASRTLDCE